MSSGQGAIVWALWISLYLMAGFLWVAHNLRSHFSQRILEEHKGTGMTHWWTLAVALVVIIWPIGLAISVLVLAIKSPHRDAKL